MARALIAGLGEKEPAADEAAAGSSVSPALASPGASGPPQARPQLRLKGVDRQQVCLRAVDVQRLVGEDHPVRAIWEMLEKCDLSALASGIKAVEGRPGRDRSDPRVLIALGL